MTMHDWVVAGALTLILAEGFALAVFPQQLKLVLQQLDVQAMRTAGLIETCIAVTLLGLLLTR